MLPGLSRFVSLRRHRKLSPHRFQHEALEDRQLLLAASAVVADIDGPASAERGKTAAFRLTATDSGATAAGAKFSFWIDWDNNGVFDQVVTGRSGTRVNHAFATAGPQTVRVLALGERGQWAQVVTQQIAVSGYRVVADADRPGVKRLVWEGTEGDDAVSFINLGGSVTIVETKLDGQEVEHIHTVAGINGTITVNARGGNDSVDGSAAGVLPLVIFGGGGADTLLGGASGDRLDGGDGNDLLAGADGNDLVVGGTGSDILAGMRGDDLIYGGAGRDLLLGGGDADLLTGEASDDLVLAGLNEFSDLGELDGQSLEAIRREWVSARTYAQRVANISGAGAGTRLNGSAFFKPGVTVFSDQSADVLHGGGQQDWFLLTRAGTAAGALPADLPLDSTPAERLTDTTQTAPVQDAGPIVILRVWSTEAQEIMDRIEAQGLDVGSLPFDGLQVMAKHTAPYDPNIRTGVKAAAAAVKRALDMGLTHSGAGLALFPQAGEWTSVAAWTRWKNELRELRLALNALGVTNDYVFGLDIEDYPVGHPARPPSLPLNESRLEASAMARAAITSGFRAELAADFGHTLRMVYPSGRAPLFNQEIAAAIVMRANGLGDEYSFVLAGDLLEGETVNDRIWSDIFARQEEFVAGLGFSQVVGGLSSLLRPENADEWERFLRITSPEVVFLYLDDKDIFLG